MIQDGTQVKVHYKGTTDDGVVFDSSEGRDPLEFTIGEGQVIAGFDAAVRKMAVGDTDTVKIPCDQAYGMPDENMFIKVERKHFPDDKNLTIGNMFELRTPTGQVRAAVSEITDDTVTLNANHPLAGRDLTFEITLMEIVE